MSNKVFVLFQVCLDIDTKLTGVGWPLHSYSEPIEILIVYFEQIHALEATEHVWNLHEPCLISYKAALELN